MSQQKTGPVAKTAEYRSTDATADDSLDNQVVIAREKFNRIDQLIEMSSEWFSALLVKETRQALKSRQFLWTFFGMLILIATWSVFLISYYQYNSSVQDMGPALLMGFWVLLGFPLAIVIPFSAFRSLAHEFEDGTIQLVSITTMRPYQIILGKLGSAFLQILIYLAALAPCIAFTYLLRGIDIKQIGLCIAVAATGSACLCCFGLFMASSARGRTMGTASSVLLLILLVITLGFWIGFAGTMTFELNSMVFMFSDRGWILTGSIFGLAITTAIVLLATTSSQISFFADNRVTLVRITLMIQHTVFLGIAIAVLNINADIYSFTTIATISTLYWFFVGSMVVSTSPEVSNRVQRNLPQTLVGRSLTSLFYPGPGRGFLFVISNIWSLGIIWILIALIGHWFMPGSESDIFGFSSISNLTPGDKEHIIVVTIVNCLYGTFYISVVYLAVRWIQSFKPNVSPGYGLGIALGLFFGFWTVSYVLYSNLDYSYGGYSLFLIGDWFNTIGEAVSGINSEEFLLVVIVLCSMTLLVGALAAIRAAGDLRFAAQAVPQRVVDEKKIETTTPLPKGESIDEIFNAPRKPVSDSDV